MSGNGLVDYYVLYCDLRHEFAALKDEVARLRNDRAALIAKLMIPDARKKGQWLVLERCGSEPSYRIFPDRGDAERFLARSIGEGA